ncbi:MAG: zinc-ribbon domain-containing protein [Myxococcota bacterium]
MIVQCENCETRFHVADARIPEKGARVRCSRCHHRFHITPSSGTATSPSAAGDVSARSQPRGGEPREEDELDNPEFLFDEQSGEQSTPSRPTPRAARPSPVAEEPPPEKPAAPAPHVPEAPPPAPPAQALEERVVATTGKTAQEMLDAGAPNLGSGSGPVEFAPALQDPDSDDTRSRFFLGDDAPPAEREPPPSIRPAKDKPARVAAPAPAAVPELEAGFGGGSLGEEVEEGDAGWDSLTRSAEPANVFEAAASFGMVTEPSVPSAPAGATRATLFDQPEPPADTKKRKAPGSAAFDPEAASPAGTIARIAACLVGVTLLAGTARGLLMQRDARVAGSEVEQAAGWTAADVETFVARDSLGERVLVVRGNLIPEGAAPPPEVQVSLLEVTGERVGEPRRAWLERLDDAEIAPDELTVKLAADPGEVSGMGPQVTGFTVLLPDPPARARRLQVTLLAGKQPTRGTATAVAPAPATPAAVQPQLATPAAVPPADAPTAPDAVVPAAPEPE